MIGVTHLRLLVKFTFFVSVVLLALGFLGAIHPFFDSLAIGRPLVAAITALVLIGWFWQRKRRSMAIITAAFASIMAYDFTHTPASTLEGKPDLRLYQHNLLFTNRNEDLPMVTTHLQPDVLTLQEIERTKPTIAKLSAYPHRLICPFATVGDVGILSRHPIVDSDCANGTYRGFAWVRIRKDNLEYTIVSLHLYWPYPFKQKQQVDEIIPILESLPQPVFLAGDFNQVSWSDTYQRIESAVNGNSIDSIHPSLTLTFNGYRLGPILPIDHVISPEGTASVQRLAQYGSDHNALLLDWQAK